MKLPPDARTRALESIKRFCDETLETEVGDLKAELFLEFCLEEICPSVYNRAIQDAQAYFLGKVEDLEGTCFEPEFGYWPKRG